MESERARVGLAVKLNPDELRLSMVPILERNDRAGEACLGALDDVSVAMIVKYWVRPKKCNQRLIGRLRGKRVLLTGEERPQMESMDDTETSVYNGGRSRSRLEDASR